ncbi:zinc transporter 8 isoform X2 [Drosophila mauritiana]|uniref:Zinc transporter 8 isoform X2 n=1 Tax=Drosophila mauritiana TaxID=7226 RepID=A0A6P8KNR9_DROMA|nr:zinc transporter 8 isoform X2 [Drosophila mauritiana]
MSKKSQDEHTKDKDSEEEDEEELQAAIREMVKIPDIDIIPRRSTQSGKQKESTVLKKNHAECGSQTGDGKDTTSKTGQKKLESDDSWAALLRKRFAWTKDNKTDAVPSEVNQNIPNTKRSSKDFIEKKKSANKLSTDFSNESLIRSEKYENCEATKSLLNNQLSEESPEFLDKLRRIEEASKPKTWKRPTPVVLKPNQNYSATKKSDNELEAKPQTATNTEETHGCINILKVPFHRNLYYVPEKPSRQDIGSGTSDFQPGAPETPIGENTAVETDQKPNEIMPENVENSNEKKTGNSDSPKTVTITGHSHITAKWDAHCHFREKETGVDKAARRVLIIACILCSIFLVLEVIGGIWANSLAIATDAAHLLTDLASFLISISALHLAARPSSERLNFGWHRAEVIGAMVSIFFIWVVTGVLVYMAIMRWVNEDFDLDAKIMLITSALAILFNVIMAMQLQHGHSHSLPGVHKMSKDTLLGKSVSVQYAAKGHENINVRAAIIHVVGDLIQSFGVFVAALIIFFWPEWAFMDSVCTFVFSVLVLVVTFKILRDVLMVLMEATPDFMDYEEVKQTFLSISGVVHVHNLRIWALSINKVALSAHLAISKDADPQLILEEATTLIHKRFKFFETTIQIEEYSPGMENCGQCLSPSEKNGKRKSVDPEKGEGRAGRKRGSDVEKTKNNSGSE